MILPPLPPPPSTNPHIRKVWGRCRFAVRDLTANNTPTTIKRTENKELHPCHLPSTTTSSEPNHNLNTGKMSAIAEDVHEKVRVLFLMYAGMDAIDVCGPLQVFGSAQHEMGNESQ